MTAIPEALGAAPSQLGAPSPLRLACVDLPDFEIWARCRLDPNLRDIPLAIAKERGPLLALSPQARRSGLRTSMTLTQALAILPTLRHVPPDADLVRSQGQIALHLLQTFSPGVEAVESGRYFVDLTGLGRLFGLEPELARRIRAALRQIGYPAAIGIASGKLLAAIAATAAEGRLCIVPAGTEATFLGPLPLTVLPLDPELCRALIDLGLATIGDWLRLPTTAIAARFGQEAARLHSMLIRIDDDSILEPARDAPRIEVENELDPPIDDLAQLAVPLEQAVERIAALLGRRQLETSRIRAVLRLDDHSQAIREASFVRPTAVPRLLLDCLRLALARDTLPAAVAGFVLTARELSPARADQLQLFARRATGDIAAIEAALARVRALVGPDGVVSPRPADSHRPEAATSWSPYQQAAHRRSPRVHRQAEAPPGPALRHLPARLLAQPRPIEVRLQRGRPIFVAFDHVHSPVDTSDGPHRLEGEWWAVPYARNYYNLRLRDGERIWVFQDRQGWFLQGMFD